MRATIIQALQRLLEHIQTTITELQAITAEQTQLTAQALSSATLTKESVEDIRLLLVGGGIAELTTIARGEPHTVLLVITLNGPPGVSFSATLSAGKEKHSLHRHCLHHEEALHALCAWVDSIALGTIDTAA